MFVINVGLGARTGYPPNSIQQRAMNLLHVTQWAAHHNALMRLVNGYDADPTVVLWFDRKPGYISFRSELKTLPIRCSQSAISVFDSNTGQREFIGDTQAFPNDMWDDSKFYMPQAVLTLSAWKRLFEKNPQDCRFVIPRRDYGLKDDV